MQKYNLEKRKYSLVALQNHIPAQVQTTEGHNIMRRLVKQIPKGSAEKQVNCKWQQM